MEDSTRELLMDILIPVVAAAIAISVFAFSYPPVREAMVRAAELSGVNFVPMGDAMLVAGICLFLGFIVQRIIMASNQYRSRRNLMDAAEIGSKQLNEIQDMLAEILNILRSRKRP
jgi:hypothetical protein